MSVLHTSSIALLERIPRMSAYKTIENITSGSSFLHRLIFARFHCIIRSLSAGFEQLNYTRKQQTGQPFLSCPVLFWGLMQQLQRAKVYLLKEFGSGAAESIGMSFLSWFTNKRIEFIVKNMGLPSLPGGEQ